jgi:hypothetical protein
MYKLAVGESVVIYARGNSTEGKWFMLLPLHVAVTWKADENCRLLPHRNIVTVWVVKLLDYAMLQR